MVIVETSQGGELELRLGNSHDLHTQAANSTRDTQVGYHTQVLPPLDAIRSAYTATHAMPLLLRATQPPPRAVCDKCGIWLE